MLGKVTNVVLVSDETSGSGAYVRLAEMPDGRSVVLKTFARPNAEHLLMEARSAKFLSDLGIGAGFHGLFLDAEGRWNLVMDIVPGDFSGTPITPRTFADLDTMLARLEAAGVHELGDFQMHRTPSGRLLAIDPGGISSHIGEGGRKPTWKASSDFNLERVELLKKADRQMGLRYLERLQRLDRRSWQAVIQTMRDSAAPELRPYRSYLAGVER